MTQFEYTVKPLYPKIEGLDECKMSVCWLIVEDITRTINFRKDLLWFEVKYLYTNNMGETGRIIWAKDAKIMCSTRAYLRNPETKGIDDYIFNFRVEFDCPLQLTISSPDNCDLSILSVKTRELTRHEKIQ